MVSKEGTESLVCKPDGQEAVTTEWGMEIFNLVLSGCKIPPIQIRQLKCGRKLQLKLVES